MINLHWLELPMARRLSMVPKVFEPLKVDCILLHMNILNKTESPMFVLLCVLCFQRQPFKYFIILKSWGHKNEKDTKKV